jgi:hypothetical protein
MILSSLTQQIRSKANKYGYYTHDVRIAYPPKTRSKIWKLPVHRKLLFVTNGHINDYTNREANEAPKAKPVTVISFAKCNTYKLIENFSRAEFEFVVENAAKIRAMFDEQQGKLKTIEEADATRNSRYLCR